MPVVCDFVEIIGDKPIVIGDDLPVWEGRFDTGGRRGGSAAFLIFNVRGLTFTSENVNVKINNKIIGQIARYGGLNDVDKTENGKYWYTQMIALSGSDLRNGSNEIQVEAVGFPDSTNTNKFDNFQLKNLICFFHQDT